MSLWWASIQYGQYSYKKRTECRQVSRKAHVKHREIVIYKVRKGLRRNQLCGHVDLRDPASRTGRRYFCYLSHLICVTLLWQPKQANTVNVCPF